MSLRGTRTRIHLLASRTHKWLALLLGIQLLLWFASGAVMSFFPIDRIHGDHLVDRKTVEPMPSGTKIAAFDQFADAFGQPIETISTHMLLGRPVAEVTGGGKVALFDAATGKSTGPIDGSTAIKVARKAWRGPATAAATAEAVASLSTEYRGSLPAWRVAFSDPDGTRVFVDARTGRIAAVRTGTWRLYDFFWGLHIMDWKNHENFNSPWLLGFAIGGLMLWIGGATLLFLRWPRRRHGRSAARET